MRIGFRRKHLTFVLYWNRRVISLECWIGNKIGIFINGNGVIFTKSGIICFEEGRWNTQMNI